MYISWSFELSLPHLETCQVFMATFQCDSFLAAAETAIEESTQQEQHAQDWRKGCFEVQGRLVGLPTDGKWAPKI